MPTDNNTDDTEDVEWQGYTTIEPRCPDDHVSAQVTGRRGDDYNDVEWILSVMSHGPDDPGTCPECGKELEYLKHWPNPPIT